jgi:hypothetical protein
MGQAAELRISRRPFMESGKRFVHATAFAEVVYEPDDIMAGLDLPTQLVLSAVVDQRFHEGRTGAIVTCFLHRPRFVESVGIDQNPEEGDDRTSNAGTRSASYFVLVAGETKLAHRLIATSFASSSAMNQPLRTMKIANWTSCKWWAMIGSVRKESAMTTASDTTDIRSRLGLAGQAA